MPETFAAADIGSNTVHLLVADVVGRSIQRRLNRSEWLSLGEDVATTGLIPADKVRLLHQVFQDYLSEVTRLNCGGFYCFATEAIRSAKNGPEVIASIEEKLGFKIDIISPEKEAELSLKGVQIDVKLPDQCLLFELGGGSAQIAHCLGAQIQSESSLPIGTGRLKAAFPISIPAAPSLVNELRTYITSQLDSQGIHGPMETAVASGGVIRGIWRALHPDLQNELQAEELDYLIWAASRLSTEHLTQRFNVKPKRAAILLYGAIVYRQLMAHFSVQKILVSEFGVREGAILKLSEGIGTQWQKRKLK